jgi:glycosyltransferase involved in cell wall biosynthesis
MQESSINCVDDIMVSVIIPIYNVGKYINKCIETIIKQTHRNLEIILINDGSLDDSGAICDKYAERDRRIIVIHKQNAGVSAARNSGIEVASGDYVCFVDGDDYVMPDYVEYMLYLAQKYNAEIALTTGMFGNFTSGQISNDKIEVWSGEDATEGILCYRIPIGVYCKIFRRDFISSNIRFVTNLFIGEGFNFNTAAFQKANKVIIGHRRIYYYRRDNPTSATTKFSEAKWINGLYAIDLIKQNFIIRSKRLETAWEYAHWRTCSDVYDIMVLASVQKKYPDLYKKSLYVTRSRAKCALKVPISKKDKIRAMVMAICPSLIPLAMRWRRMKYNANV